MKAKHSILKNSGWNGLASLVGTLLLLATTPLYLRTLGEDKFGLYMLLVAVTAPFEILNAGVAQATIKYLAEWLPNGRLRESAAMVRVNLLFNLVAGVIAIIGLWFAAPWLADTAFKIPGNLRSDAILSFRLAAPVWFVMQISQSLSAPTVAEQNFRLSSIVQTVRFLALYLGGAAVVLWYGSVASLQIWSLVTLLGACGFWAWLVVMRLGLRAILPGFNRIAFRKSFGFSSWQMLNGISAAASQQVDRILLGSMLGTTAVAAYGLAASIQMRGVQLVWSAFGSLFPAISQNATLRPVAAERQVIHIGNTLSAAACLAYGLLALFAKDICTVWLGASTKSYQVAFLLIMLMFVAIVGVPSAQFSQFILGWGLTRLNFIGNTAMAVITTIVSWFSISIFGISGAVLGVLAGVILTRIPLHLWIATRHMKSGTSAFQRFWNIYSVPFAVLVSGVFAGMIKYTLAPTDIFSVQNAGISLVSVSLLVVGALLLQKLIDPGLPVINEIRDKLEPVLATAANYLPKKRP